MKKTILLFTFFLAGIIVSNAQITITQSDVAGAGNVMQLAHDTEKDTMPGSINPGPSGANQTWIFSALLSSTVDTLTFTNPASLPNGSNFPSANLAIVNSTDGSEIYLENISSGLFVVGAYGDTTGQGAMAIPFNPKEQLAAFPATYNTAFQNTSGFDFAFPFTLIPGIDSLRIKEVKIKDIKADGWGTITTPLGTYSCLRNRGRVITIDTVFAHPVGPPGWVDIGPPYTYTDTAWHFSWWANGIGFPLLEFDSTAGDTIRNISWIKTLPYAGTSETAPLSGVSVYPNPSSGVFSVQPATGNWQLASSEKPEARIEIYNLMGEKVYSLDVPINNEQLTINLFQPSGIYFLHISNEKGTATRKIIISK